MVTISLLCTSQTLPPLSDLYIIFILTNCDTPSYFSISGSVTSEQLSNNGIILDVLCDKYIKNLGGSLIIEVEKGKEEEGQRNAGQKE